MKTPPKLFGTSLEPLLFWRRDVTATASFDFLTSSLASTARLGAGAFVLSRRRSSPVPRRAGRPAIELYEMESCPYSRLVREALTMLELDALVIPCPAGASKHRERLARRSGDVKVPYLVDHAEGWQGGESAEIVAYLFRRYGDGRVPLRLDGHVALSSSKLASEVRGRRAMEVDALGVRPQQPLVLWGYEASPYTRLVREDMSLYALPYVSRVIARRSPRRPAFVAETGRCQFPYLEDPNEDVRLFDSARIRQHLRATYGPSSRAHGQSVANGKGVAMDGRPGGDPREAKHLAS